MSESSNGDRLESIEALIKSNAKAIQALTENGSEAKKERARLYQIMGDLAQSHASLAQSHASLAQSHANLAQAQADNEKLLYRFMENLEEQQQQWKQRQDALEEQQQQWKQRQDALEEQQQQWKHRQDTLEEQQQRLIKTQADITEILKFLTINKS